MASQPVSLACPLAAAESVSSTGKRELVEAAAAVPAVAAVAPVAGRRPDQPKSVAELRWAKDRRSYRYQGQAVGLSWDVAAAVADEAAAKVPVAAAFAAAGSREVQRPLTWATVAASVIPEAPATVAGKAAARAIFAVGAAATARRADGRSLAVGLMDLDSVRPAAAVLRSQVP